MELEAPMTAEEGAKWKAMHGQLCFVELQLRWCIQELMKVAPEVQKGTALARVLWSYDLWPARPAVSADDGQK